MIELILQRHLKNGPYVEFNVSGTTGHFKHWDDESLFLDESVFQLFADCFEKSTGKFNYYGPTRYEQDDLHKLLKELNQYDRRLQQITSYETLQKVISSLFGGTYFLRDLKESFELSTNWNNVASSLVNVNRTLCDLVYQCIQEGKYLWVIGI